MVMCLALAARFCCTSIAVRIALEFALARCAVFHHDALVVMMWYHHMHEYHQKGKKKRYGYYLVVHNKQR